LPGRRHTQSAPTISSVSGYEETEIYKSIIESSGKKKKNCLKFTNQGEKLTSPVISIFSMKITVV